MGKGKCELQKYKSHTKIFVFYSKVFGKLEYGFKHVMPLGCNKEHGKPGGKDDHQDVPAVIWVGDGSAQDQRTVLEN